MIMTSAIKKKTEYIDDEELITAKAISGDMAAFACVYEKYLPHIYKYIKIQVVEDDIACDLAHDVFVGAINSINQLKNISSIKMWLFACARRRVLNYWRSENIRSYTNIEKSIDEIGEEAYSDSALFLMDHHDDILVVVNAIQRMTESQRDVISARFGLGLSVAETATLLDRSISSVKNLQLAALDRVRVEFKKRNLEISKTLSGATR